MQNLEVIISTLLIVVAVATVLVNIIVEVLKKITWDLIPTNLLAFIVAEAITLLAFFAICQVRGIPVVWYMVAVAEAVTLLSFLAICQIRGTPVAWYMVAAAVVLGLTVAYAAMFGFDKLQELIEQLGIIKSRKEQP